ncbi:helix-turn-helix domain-containing protein [Lacticaseibacillus jixianensis]|uniref:Helix-turn-helix domain-containing protein n=1 Tax=Lacticaseibacillus jixianensis TaxID=2486012 RepID=A0ABW4B8G2_9LACO|nr:helix-turn-helix domain-containing protein [Lacticaseibacillus jixianensis]
MAQGFMAWPDERSGMQSFLKGEISALPVGRPIGVKTDTLREKKDSIIMFMGLYAREAITLGVAEQDADQLCLQYIAEIEAADDVSFEAVVHQVQWGFRDRVLNSRANRYSLHVNQALAFIDQHLFTRLTVKMVAEYAGISERHLGQLFRREVGTTLTVYITDAKITAAKRLLRSDRYTVSEISDMLGYANVSYFCSMFKKTTKISPKQYEEAY